MMPFSWSSSRKIAVTHHVIAIIFMGPYFDAETRFRTIILLNLTSMRVKGEVPAQEITIGPLLENAFGNLLFPNRQWNIE